MNLVIKEDLEIHSEYFELSNGIIEQLKTKGLSEGKNIVVAICGESGSGKSITATCLQQQLAKSHINSILLNQDGYFFLPPKNNSAKRKKDISWVGSNEVNLKAIQDNISDFQSGQPLLQITTVDYLHNSFDQTAVSTEGVQVLIVEGTYALMLDDIDLGIFIARDYRDTIDSRKARNREVYDPFVEEVLLIEHKLILPLRTKADLIIDKGYKLCILPSEDIE